MTRAAWARILAIMLITAALRLHAADNQEIASLLETATAFHQQGNYAQSIPLLRRVVKLSPRNYVANLMLGEDLLRSGRPQDALQPLRTAADVRPDDVTARDYIVAAAEALGNTALESEALEAALIRSRGDEKHLMAWANFCLNRFDTLQVALLATRQGQGEEFRVEAWGTPEGTELRESLLEQSAVADPEQRGIWGELGVAQLQRGLRSKARTSLAEAERRDPQNAMTLRLEALLAAEEHDWPAAEDRLLLLGSRSPAELNSALESWPPAMTPEASVSGKVWNCIRNSSAECSLAPVAPHSGQSLSAKDLYAEGRWEQLVVLPINEESPVSEWLWRGIGEARMLHCAQAIPSLERGLKANESEGSFYLQVCYADQESRVEDRLNEAGKMGALHELKGDRALTVAHDPASATKEYLEGLRSRPRDTRLLARLAEAYTLLGDSTHARSAALDALAVDPHQVSALKTLVQVALNERNYTEALVRLKTLVSLQPNDPWSLIRLGVVYGQLKQPSEAVHYLAPLLSAGYPDPKGALHAQLAKAFRDLGREDEAKKTAAEAWRLANESLQGPVREKADAH